MAFYWMKEGVPSSLKSQHLTHYCFTGEQLLLAFSNLKHEGRPQPNHDCLQHHNGLEHNSDPIHITSPLDEIRNVTICHGDMIPEPTKIGAGSDSMYGEAGEQDDNYDSEYCFKQKYTQCPTEEPAGEARGRGAEYFENDTEDKEHYSLDEQEERFESTGAAPPPGSYYYMPGVHYKRICGKSCQDCRRRQNKKSRYQGGYWRFGRLERERANAASSCHREDRNQLCDVMYTKPARVNLGSIKKSKMWEQVHEASGRYSR